jgi:hypothetical protein
MSDKMDKKGMVESNVGKAIIALILLAVLLFIVYLARKQILSLISSLRGII